MVYLKRILMTTDLSDYSLAALEYAASFGLLYGSRLFLLYVVEGNSRTSPQQQEVTGTRNDPGADERDALADVRRLIESRTKPEITIEPAVRTGNAAEQITQFAEEEGIDLIVIATHGRTGLKHILMGSVAEKVVRHSRVPVLAVKPPTIAEEILFEEDIEDELHIR